MVESRLGVPYNYFKAKPNMFEDLAGLAHPELGAKRPTLRNV